jgi:uncharacterized protein YqhQ
MFKKVICPHCGRNTSADLANCEYCDGVVNMQIYEQNLQVNSKSCPFCGKKISISSAVCPYCNETVDEDRKKEIAAILSAQNESMRKNSGIAVKRIALSLFIFLTIIDIVTLILLSVWASGFLGIERFLIPIGIFVILILFVCYIFIKAYGDLVDNSFRQYAEQERQTELLEKHLELLTEIAKRSNQS